MICGWEDCFAVPLAEARLLCGAVTSATWLLFLEEGPIYLLYLDESGTHGGSPVFILAGLALHEQDAWHLQGRLNTVVKRFCPAGLDPADFELHAAEMKNPIRPNRPPSAWASVPMGRRLDAMRATYRALAKYSCMDDGFPCALFGAAVDSKIQDREVRAYEEVLHKFDELLTRQAHETNVHQRGIVIHDRRVIEGSVQRWTREWREVAGRIGRLDHLADVPFFADSKASRLIQAADFVSWGLWRYYGPTSDESWINPLWSKFDNAGGTMHGLIHVHPQFRRGKCQCPPCVSRAT